MYRHDPWWHGLVRIAGPSKAMDCLLAGAAGAMERATAPQVLLVLAARFELIAWKYEGIAYALVLKLVGVMLQTMYLAATGIGLDPLVEGAVGEFALSSLPAGDRP